MATSERALVAFVDKTIKTDLCILSLSPDAEIQVQKVMQRILNMDYRITEAGTKFFQVNGVEDLQDIPEARMYAVLVDNSTDNFILEDPKSGKKGVRFQAVDKLLNKGGEEIRVDKKEKK